MRFDRCADKQDGVLKPAGDQLEATGSFKVGASTKAVVVDNVVRKSATARFVLN